MRDVIYDRDTRTFTVHVSELHDTSSTGAAGWEHSLQERFDQAMCALLCV